MSTRNSWPKVLLDAPSPRLEQVSVTNHLTPVYSGRVKVESVKGWTDNPRIRVLVSRFKNNFGREPNQDDIYDIMKKDEDCKLKLLRDDIMSNGVRHPVWLSKDGRLLDGNRRYFAVRYAIDSLPETDPRRSTLSSVPALVLTEDSTEEDEHRVVVQMNFSNEFKEPWPDLVKAMMVYEDHVKGLSEAALKAKYDWSSQKVKSAIRTYTVIEEFRSFVTEDKDPEDSSNGGLGKSENEANEIANKHYQKFNEAQQSFREALDSNFEFKRVFFRLIAENKFHSWTQVRTAWDAYQDPNIRPILLSDDPEATNKSRLLVESKKAGVVAAMNNSQRIMEFVTFLHKLKMEEVLKLTPENLSDLHTALVSLNKVVESTVAASKNSHR